MDLRCLVQFLKTALQRCYCKWSASCLGKRLGCNNTYTIYKYVHISINKYIYICIYVQWECKLREPNLSSKARSAVICTNQYKIRLKNYLGSDLRTVYLLTIIHLYLSNLYIFLPEGKGNDSASYIVWIKKEKGKNTIIIFKYLLAHPPKEDKNCVWTEMKLYLSTNIHKSFKHILSLQSSQHWLQ